MPIDMRWCIPSQAIMEIIYYPNISEVDNIRPVIDRHKYQPNDSSIKNSRRK